MKPIYDLVLFDLDGTLSDSEPGVTVSVKGAIERMGFPAPDRATLRRFIGPPLWESFVKFCGMTDAQAEQAVDYFRETYNVTGAFDNVLYPHMPELLDELKQAGALLAVATSKPDNIARRVLEYFDVTRRMDYIAAAEENEHNSSKSELILAAINACGVPKERAVMIGDTHFDATGARQAGTNFIGALYGFGAKEEMEREGATVFARDVPELGKLLLA